MSHPSLGGSRSSSKRSTSNYSRSFRLPDEDHTIVGAMLSIFLDDLTRLPPPGPSSGRFDQDLVELELQAHDANVYVCSVTPRAAAEDSGGGGGILSRSLSAASSVLKMLRWPRSSEASSDAGETPTTRVMKERQTRRMRFQLQKSSSRAQRALSGLRFISKKTTTTGEDAAVLWAEVAAKFDELADEHGLLSRERFAECIGMVDSKEFALGIFDALARRKRQRITAINKEQLYDFWQMLSDQRFDARLQIFFDMVDSNEDGRITRDEVQEVALV